MGDFNDFWGANRVVWSWFFFARSRASARGRSQAAERPGAGAARRPGGAVLPGHSADDAPADHGSRDAGDADEYPVRAHAHLAHASAVR